MAPRSLPICLLALVMVSTAVSRYVDEEKGLIEDIEREDYEVYPEDPDAVVIEGDIQIDLSRNAISSDSKRWPNGVVPYVIDSTYPSTERLKILSAMKEIESDVNPPGSKTCIQFVPRTSQANYVSVQPVGSTCSSFIGDTHSGGQVLKLGNGCVANGIIMHEFVHALGFWHEHSHPDRDRYVHIDLTRVQSSHKSNYNIHSTARRLNAPYDYGSIMHYNPYEFAIDKNKPVMTPSQTVTIKMGQRMRLSPIDVLKIQRLYGCTEDTSHREHRDLECTFDHNDLCDYVNGGDFNWVSGKGQTANSYGPYADSSIGNGYYALARASGHSGRYAHLVSKKEYHDSLICINLYMFNYSGDSSFKIGVLLDGSRDVTKITSYSGQKSKKWYHLKVEYRKPSSSRSFKVALSAKMGNNDIGLDDVIVYSGHC